MQLENVRFVGILAYPKKFNKTKIMKVINSKIFNEERKKTKFA